MSDGPRDVMDGLHRLLQRGAKAGPGSTIGEEVIPTLERLVKALLAEPDIIIQQKAIEMLLVQHAARMGNIADSMTIVDGVAKHARQMVIQGYEEGHL